MYINRFGSGVPLNGRHPCSVVPDTDVAVAIAKLLDDEPAIPATGRYVRVHTSAWSEKISSAGAVIFVTPQYNWGYPAALKNAIDHLYGEWRDKPAVIVTYGGHGGQKCSEQLKQVSEAVKLRRRNLGISGVARLPLRR